MIKSEYQWDRNFVNALSSIVDKRGSEMEKENMDIMKSILDDNVDIDKLYMVDFKGRFTYRKAYNMYSSGMEHFPGYIIDIIMSLYKINPEPDGLITFEELDNIDLSDEQFLLLGRDCVEQLNMRKLTSLYDEITNKDTHMLHMVSGDKLGGNQTDLEGITLNFPVINRSYIYLYRNLSNSPNGKSADVKSPDFRFL